MPQRKAVQTDQAFLARLIGARKEAKLTQPAIAELLRLSPSAYAHYESGRNNISYEVALEFCTLTGVNPRWLATGKLPKQAFISLSEDLRVSFLESKGRYRNCDFLTGYHEYLAPNINDWIEKNWSLFQIFEDPEDLAKGLETAELLDHILEFAKRLENEERLLNKVGWLDNLGIFARVARERLMEKK